MNQLYDIAQSAIQGLTPFHALTGAGVCLSSYLFLSQLGGARFGVPPMVCNAATRQSLSIPIELAVRQWNFFFARATAPIVVAVAGGSVAYLAASFCVSDRNGAKADALRTWLRFAALVAILPLPYTIRTLGPINKSLVAFGRQNASSLGVSDASKASALLEGWAGRHSVRIGLYGLSVLVGIVPLLASR